MQYKTIVTAGLCLALTSPASANPENVEPSELQGNFYFYTYAQKNGQPVCSERWHFGEDGTLTIFNGQEVLTEHFRVEDRETLLGNSTKTVKSSWLMSSDAMSNGLPDCLGHTNTTLKAVEDVIYRAMDGGIAICRQFTNYMSCYGHLYRASDIDAAEKKTAPVQ